MVARSSAGGFAALWSGSAVPGTMLRKVARLPAVAYAKRWECVEMARSWVVRLLESEGQGQATEVVALRAAARVVDEATAALVAQAVYGVAYMKASTPSTRSMCQDVGSAAHAAIRLAVSVAWRDAARVADGVAASMGGVVAAEFAAQVRAAISVEEVVSEWREVERAKSERSGSPKSSRSIVLAMAAGR